MEDVEFSYRVEQVEIQYRVREVDVKYSVHRPLLPLNTCPLKSGHASTTS